MLLSSSDTKEHWFIYSCLQTPPRENWFPYLRREYATAINFPCIITLTQCKVDPARNVSWQDHGATKSSIFVNLEKKF